MRILPGKALPGSLPGRLLPGRLHHGRAGRRALPTIRRSAALILAANPLGGVCGAVCPDKYCVRACAKADVDRPVRIPAVQAEIIRRAKKLRVMPDFAAAPETGLRAAVVGAGPAGLAAAALLAQNGLAVEVFERDARAGGMVNLIPDFRFDKDVLRSDIRFLSASGAHPVRLGRSGGRSAPALLEQGFAAVVVATGLDRPLRLGIPGEELAQDWIGFLSRASAASLAGRRVAVIGGGAVAADCAETAARAGASVEMICLETPGEMPLTAEERDGLLAAGALITGRSAVTSIRAAARPENSPHPADAPAARPFVQPQPRCVRDPAPAAVLPESMTRSSSPSAPAPRSRFATCRVFITRAIWPKGRARSFPPWLPEKTPLNARSTDRLEAHAASRPRERAGSSCPAAIFCPCRSKPIFSAGRSSRLSCSPPRRPPTASNRCGRPTRPDGPAAS